MCGSKERSFDGSHCWLQAEYIWPLEVVYDWGTLSVTLPPYTRNREGEGMSLVPGVEGLLLTDLELAPCRETSPSAWNGSR